MNYGQLKAAVASHLHRTDLSNEIEAYFIPQAIDAVKRRLNVAVGPFVQDTDTDPFTDEYPNLIVFKAVSDGFIWIHNGDAATVYQDRWGEEIDHYYIPNYNGTESPVIGVYDGSGG